MREIQIKVGIVGVGNAASAFIQGLFYYNANPNNIGLVYNSLAGYTASDLIIVSAIDISKDKVGFDLSEAIFKGANRADKIIDVPKMNVMVSMGNPLDGLIEETNEIVQLSEQDPQNVAEIFKNTDTEIVLCLLPSGADKAVEYYADEANKAGCGFINATPTSLATNPISVQKFKDSGLPLVGDDLQDQIGSTILHKLILKQMEQRGVKITESYALDVGGGVESLNTIHRARDIKRKIKSESIKSALEGDADIVAGTSDYVPHLENNRNTLIAHKQYKR